jgi:hypothetical protein
MMIAQQAALNNNPNQMPLIGLSEPIESDSSLAAVLPIAAYPLMSNGHVVL